MKTISYPKVGQTKDLKVFVSFYLNNQRYRLYNGKRIGSLLEPNSFPEDKESTRVISLLPKSISTYPQDAFLLIIERIK